jgi:hypothetical protein
LTIAFLGFTFLIAALFPVGPQFIQFALGGYLLLLKGAPAIVVKLLTLVLTFFPAAIVTAWFFRRFELRARVSDEVPGKRLMSIGVVLTCAYVAAFYFASTIPGGGPAYVVGQFSPFVLWPARAFLAVGVVKFLLAVRPSDQFAETAPSSA